MAIDYSEQRYSPRNRPNRQPVGRYMLTFLLMLGLAYGGGFLTAWYLYRPASLATQAKAKAADPASPRQQAASQSQPAPAAAPKTGQDVPLSFYENLQKGNKSIIGSGLNPQKGQEQTVKNSPPSTPNLPQQAAKKPESAQSQVKQAPSAPPPSNEEGRFVVQVASTKERKEAEELASRLTAKGYGALVSESKLEGKGTWFRVRVGKHLSRAEAEVLAQRIKSGAVVVQEK